MLGGTSGTIGAPRMKLKDITEWANHGSALGIISLKGPQQIGHSVSSQVMLRPNKNTLTIFVLLNNVCRSCLKLSHT
jgi:hypothetical protein